MGNVVTVSQLCNAWQALVIVNKLLGPEQGTCKDPIVFQMIIRAQAGNLRGPYCFWKDSLFLGPEQGTCKDPIVFERILY